MESFATIQGIIEFEEKILVLKRNSKRKTNPGKWQFVTGFIKERESGEKAVLREIKEETGLTGKIEKTGKVFEATDQWGRWIIFSYLVSVESSNIKIDLEEHSEFKWIKPEEINDFDCAKGTIEGLKLFSKNI